MIKINNKVRILDDAGFEEDIKPGYIGQVVETILAFGPGYTVDIYGVKFAGGVSGEVFYFMDKHLFLVGDEEHLTRLPYSCESTTTGSGSHGMEGIF